jgi:hypothetical protein
MVVSAHVVNQSPHFRSRPGPVIAVQKNSILKEAIMAKRPPNQGKPWTPDRVREVKTLAAQNTPTRVIALKTGRSPDAIYGVASDKNISLKPTNQRPYGTKK